MKGEVGSSKLGLMVPISRLTNDESQTGKPQASAYDMWTPGVSTTSLLRAD